MHGLAAWTESFPVVFNNGFNAAADSLMEWRIFTTKVKPVFTETEAVLF
jgi:hypothetical protein